MTEHRFPGEVRPLRKVKNDFSRLHPTNNKKNNDFLVAHIKERLDFATPVRNILLQRYKRIDKEMAGYVRFDKDEREAERSNADGDPKPGKTSLPLVDAQLDELLTFLMSVFAPDSDLYEALADKNKQDAAAAFTLLMNKNAKIMGYYRQYARTMGDMLKYNLGGVSVGWKTIEARKPKFNASKTFVAEDVQLEEVWAGNEVTALDMYNVLWDIAHSPIDVSKKGEFVATVAAHTEFAIRRMHTKKEITNLVTQDLTEVTELKYYEPPPEVTPDYEFGDNSRSRTTGSNVDFVNILSAGATQGTVKRAYEIVTYTSWLIPADFGLSKSTNLEIWRVQMFNAKKIVFAEPLKNFHEMLPYAFAMPIEDGLGLQQKTFAEKLIPLQQFAAFLLNNHMAASRKALGGIEVYDPSIIPLDQVGDKVSARVPINAAGWGKPIGDAMRNFGDAPDTASYTMSMITNIADIMQGLLPTNIRKQLGNLERATQFEAAATVQGSSQRNLKMARFINDQCWNKVRQMMLFNILQFQDEVTIIDPQTGQDVEVSAAQFVDFDLDHVIDEGLKSLDRLSVITFLREILNAVLQSKDAQREIDVVALLDYYTSLMGDNTDMTRFKKTQEQRQQDVALEQQAKTPIAPVEGEGAAVPV